MQIYLDEQLKQHNPYLEKIKNYIPYSSEMEYDKNEINIIISPRKNNYILPYDYGEGVRGKGEYVLRWGSGCIYDCVYCFPKARFNNNPLIRIFPEIDKIISELSMLNYSKKLLLNAGENFDSFLFENIIPFSETLTNELFKLSDKIQIEFRTKALVTETFIKNANKKNCIIAFSISPESIRKFYESKAPELALKINNLTKLQKAGFKTAIRFEPVILTEHFKENYIELFKNLAHNGIFKNLDSVDISLLRLTKNNYSTLIETNPELLRNEWLYHEQHKKYRYFSGIRVKAYKFLIEELKKYYAKPVHIGTEPEEFVKKL